MRIRSIVVMVALSASGFAQGTADERRTTQAVIETTMGTIVIDLLADRAPNHVALFIKTARAGGYDGTTFHRLVRQGIIQGGDPLTKDPAAKARDGTGGLNLLEAEINPEKHTRGAVSAVLIANRPDSAGTQFFICIIDQPSLEGQYTVFGRVAEGILIAQKISEAPADEKGAPVDRIEMKTVTIREKPAPTVEPFVGSSHRFLTDVHVGSSRRFLTDVHVGSSWRCRTFVRPRELTSSTRVKNPCERTDRTRVANRCEPREEPT